MVSSIVVTGVGAFLLMAVLFGVSGKRLYDNGQTSEGKEKLLIAGANVFLALTVLSFPLAELKSYHAFFLFSFVVVLGFGAFVERRKRDVDAS